MSKKLKTSLIVFGSVGLLAMGCWLFPKFFLSPFLDYQNRPSCHKILMLAVNEWQNTHTTNTFPNHAGSSAASLSEIAAGDPSLNEFTNHYNYVAGLSPNDPGHLVLFYLRTPTRWIWHGVPQSRLRKKTWMIIPLDFAQGNRNPEADGELSERVSEEVFTVRLKETLDFVRTNNRPHWQSVVEEHSRFLSTLKAPK